MERIKRTRPSTVSTQQVNSSQAVVRLNTAQTGTSPAQQEQQGGRAQEGGRGGGGGGETRGGRKKEGGKGEEGEGGAATNIRGMVGG
jgi:hypothetical protein